MSINDVHLQAIIKSQRECLHNGNQWYADVLVYGKLTLYRYFLIASQHMHRQQLSDSVLNIYRGTIKIKCHQPFKLEVDASEVGAGAVLLQEAETKVDHPVCYFTRKFNKHQLRYSSIEKEALALVLALQYFEVYVGSSPLPGVVFTDHNALVFLSRMQNQIGRAHV